MSIRVKPTKHHHDGVEAVASPAQHRRQTADGEGRDAIQRLTARLSQDRWCGSASSFSTA